MADSNVVKNWHFAGINFVENVVVNKRGPGTTKEFAGSVTKIETCVVVLEAQLVPPLDPYDTGENPATIPSMEKTSNPPAHGCYVDNAGKLHATVLQQLQENNLIQQIVVCDNGKVFYVATAYGPNESNSWIDLFQYHLAL